MSLTKISYSMTNGAPFNVLDFGADLTGQTDSTAAFQAAFDAAAAQSESSAGPITSNATVFAPAGVYYIAGTVSVNKRIGFYGDSVNTVITGTSPTSTSPSTCGFRFNDPATTGIAPQIYNLTFFGFQSGPCVDVETSGTIITDCFFSSSSEGIRLSPNASNGPASDIVIGNIIFDQNLVDIAFHSAINVVVSNCVSYLANISMYFEAVQQGNSDISFSNCMFNYGRLASVFCDNAGGNKNVQLDGCSFMLNQQYSTFLCFIYIGPSAGSAEFFINDCDFRNWKDYAIRIVSDNVVTINSCVFDANKTLGGYTQSSASTALQFVGATIPTPVQNCSFRNIQNYAVEASSASVVTVVNSYLINTSNFETSSGGSIVNQSNVTQQNGNNIAILSNQIQLTDIGTLRFVTLAADPAGVVIGDMYYNSVTNKLRLNTNAGWVNLN